MGTVLQDLQFGGRMLLKNKAFTLVALAALALGIGANTAIFSLVNGVLLRPLPFPHAEQIVYFEGQNPSQDITDSNVSYLDFTDWSKQTDLFASTAAFYTSSSNLGADGAGPERVPRAGVTSAFFNVLGVQPFLGRVFRPEEDQPNAQTVVIISHGLWKRRFGADPGIIGKQVQMNARRLTVVGVMPPGFEFPEQTQVWATSGVELSEEPREIVPGL
jgi:putative ABC transport system permease protein